MALIVNIRKKLHQFTLNADFEIDSSLALLGASGSGKSMTLKCIAGIEKPDEGVIILDGRTLYDSKKKINLPPQKRNVGYLFQNYALFPNMTVKENIAIAAKDGDTDCKISIRMKYREDSSREPLLQGLLPAARRRYCLTSLFQQ